jgi:hypothetical protein
VVKASKTRKEIPCGVVSVGEEGTLGVEVCTGLSSSHIDVGFGSGRC